MTNQNNIEPWIRDSLDAWTSVFEACAECPAAKASASGSSLPGQGRIVAVLGELVELLFPGCLSASPETAAPMPRSERTANAAQELYECIVPVLRYYSEKGLCEKCGDVEAFARNAVAAFFAGGTAIRDSLREDITAAYEGDPAATSEMEVVISYPCIYAITVYRIAHRLVELGVPLIPRVMSEYAHFRTGIDIHPGAKIGAGFFIDHGTGVVIGGTCVIGKRVKLYQGVTLGALSFAKDADGNLVKGIKRHPDVEDNVIIYAGATILGGDTVIGHDSVIGGNVWLTHSVPPHSKVYNHQPDPIVKFKNVK